jgi:hypothetical protein
MTDIDPDAAFPITNEFADISVRKVVSDEGERLEISAPRRGLSIQLDAAQLESLTWQTPETFSGFLKSSLGPDGEDGAALDLGQEG